MKRKVWKHLPNLLTFLRILMVPAFLIAYFNPIEGFGALPMIIFLLAGLTDCMDGYIARKYELITMLGKVLDPIADKLLTASVVFSLVWSKVIPWQVLMIIVIKELYMAWGTGKCLRRKIEVQADIYGKLATVTFYPAVLLAWPWHGVRWLSVAGQCLIYLSVVMSIIAAVHYTIASLKRWSEMKAQTQAH